METRNDTILTISESIDTRMRGRTRLNVCGFEFERTMRRAVALKIMPQPETDNVQSGDTMKIAYRVRIPLLRAVLYGSQTGTKFSG